MTYRDSFLFVVGRMAPWCMLFCSSLVVAQVPNKERESSDVATSRPQKRKAATSQPVLQKRTEQGAPQQPKSSQPAISAIPATFRVSLQLAQTNIQVSFVSPRPAGFPIVASFSDGRVLSASHFVLKGDTFSLRPDTMQEPDGLRLQVPVGTHLKLQSIQGNIRVAPGAGDIYVYSVSGDVRLYGAKGSIQVQTVSGNIVVQGGQGTKITSVAGDIQASSLRGDVFCRTVSGGITLRDVQAEKVQLVSINGDIHASAWKVEHTKVRTLSGNVLLKGPFDRAASLRLYTKSGDVGLSMSEGHPFQTKISTFTGDILVFGEQGVSPYTKLLFGKQGKSSAMLSIRTHAGNIRIMKSAQ
ncbi:MAG: DUF4097 family beta strand repeat protein [Myxococcales bacterium]|nr:DUF4097 family beta strand repeat protein [Myxococcales bacterium]